MFYEHCPKRVLRLGQNLIMLAVADMEDANQSDRLQTTRIPRMSKRNMSVRFPFAKS